MSQQSCPPLTASNLKLEEKYRRTYPHYPSYTAFTVNFTAQPEFNGYTGLKVDKSETLRYLGPTLFENFFQHLLKHQRKLTTLGNVIYDEHKRGVTERLIADFDKETTLKTEIIRTISSYPEFSSSSSTTSTTFRRQLFLNSKTEIQKILSPAFNYKCAPSHVNLNDPWNPIHVTLSYTLFCRVINTQVHSDRTVDMMVLKKYNRHEGTYKRIYIQHMQSAAENDHEFLLAVISAYGTDPRLYPSYVLHMMEIRKMLNVKGKDSGKNTDGSPPPVPVAVPVSTPVITIGAKDSKKSNEASKTDHVQVKDLPNVPSPSPARASTTLDYSSTSSSSAAEIKTQTGPIPPKRNETETISLDEFNKSVKKCWTLFYGDKNITPIPPSWYENYVSQFPEPNNQSGILSNCVKVLQWDLGLNEWEPGTYKIARLEGTFPKEFQTIKQNLLPKSPSITPTVATGFEMVMQSNTSLLQQAIVQPLKLDDGNGFGANKIYSVPQPDEWSPTFSVLPFQAFQAHAYWSHKSEFSKLQDLDVEIMKLRYVEFISLLFRQNPRQFVLGTFTAYGPDVIAYPIRVLQILKRQELLRPGTTLYDFIGGLKISQDLYYDELFENGVPIPTELQVQPELIASPAPLQSVAHPSNGRNVTRGEHFIPPEKVNDRPTAAVSPAASHTQHAPASLHPIPSPALQKPTIKTSVQLLPASIPLLPPPTPSQKTDVQHTISLHDFCQYGLTSWRQFYGELTTKPIPMEWFGFFKSQFPHINNANGILDKCIQMLVMDRENFRKGIRYKIHRLVDRFPEEFKDIEKNLRDCIPKYPEVVLTPQTGLETVMLNKKSELQQALIPPPKIDKTASKASSNQQKSKHVPPPTNWSPDFSVLPFHAFRAHIYWLRQQNGLDDLTDVPVKILKLRYVEYLFIRMRKIPQLLVGIFTAYGPDVLQYPVRVLQILKAVEVLRPETKLYHAIGTTNLSSHDYVNIFGSNGPSHVIPKDLNSESVRSTTLTSTPSSSSSSLPTSLRKEIRKEVVKKDVASEVERKTLNVGYSASEVSNPQLTFGPAIADMLTISSEEFFHCVAKCWNEFYCEGTKKPIPINWYSRYKSQFPEPNNKNGILNECIANLLRTQETIKSGTPYKINHLTDLVSEASGLSMVEKDLADSVPKGPRPGLHGGSVLPWSSTSLLQAALVSPVSESNNGPTKKSVSDISDFQPTDWCPSRSVFPFPAFEAHVHWHLSQNINMGTLHGLDVEILKLRFVEYLSQFMCNTNQFLLAMFTAHGPNVMQYPVRVLEILKRRGLLRQGTKLFGVIGGESSETLYSPIFGKSELNHIPRSSGIISPPNVLVQPKSSVVSLPPVPPPGGDGDVPDSNSSTFSFENWRTECEKALEELGQNGSVQYKIPDAYYEELFHSYHHIDQNQTNHKAFRLFILGVWTGSRLAEFQINPPPPSTQSEPIQGSSRPPSTTTEVQVVEHGVVARRYETDGRLRLDEGGVRLLKTLGITPLDSVDSVHNTFVSVKKFELEALEKIMVEFPGESIKDFVKELSYRICWVTEDEDLRITAILIDELISRKLISKAHTVYCIRHGVIKNLPELLVKVLHVGSRLASFLAYLFLAEEDFCWFLTLTDELRRDYLPVWVDLAKKTLDGLRRRSSNAAVMEILSKTPGAEDILRTS